MKEILFLKRLFKAAVAAADPALCVPPALPHPPRGRTIVVGAGKAAAAMARAVERHWKMPLEGIAVTRHGHGLATRRIAVIEAGHPLPDAEGKKAAERILQSVQCLTKDDLVLALISGGGSALLTLPVEGVTLREKRALNAALLKSGAPITAMNTVRKHLSRIKGGRLAAAAFPARVVSLAISDVPHDDIATIASGPTVPDPATLASARRILKHYGIRPSPAIRRALANPANETPKPGDVRLRRTRARILATNGTARAAATKTARAAGFKVRDLGDIEGDAAATGAKHARLALALKNEGWRGVILSGGELTVTVTGKGSGGRNREYLLSLACGLNGASGIWALAADTDGIDGASDAAGAVVGPTTLARAAALGRDARAMLRANDSGAFFAVLGDALVTGPTRTNVNDIRAILIV